jgi:hypothetical protein
MQNVAECTKLNGYFIGTCYDGQAVFELLQKKRQGESFSIYRDEAKMYELTKQYPHTGFPEDETSLGYVVDVYQESINNTFSEYLVNFPYFIRVMENYGFVLVTKEESVSMGLPNGTGLFSELYATMMSELERDPRKKNEYGEAGKLTKEEKQISFLNRYFVFRKTHNVNAEKVGKLMKRRLVEEEVDESEEQAEPKRHIIRRIRKKTDIPIKIKIQTK